MSEYKKLTKKSSRIMADKSISKSFKGILRIAHILDSPDDSNATDDKNKLSDIFYNNFRTINSRKLVDIDGKINKDNTAGYPKAYPYGLDDANPISRYKSDDPFINAKLPVCDSLGNYLNINIGLNGVVFGSDESIGKATIESSPYGHLKYFPVLTSKHLVIGMTPITKAAKKSLIRNKNVKVSLEDSETDNDVKAKIIVNHTNGKKLSFDGKDYDVRTVYSIENKKYADNHGLIVSQESWNESSFNNNCIDLTTSLVDLKKYVTDRVEKYINSNTVPVPTASVIWEYVSLWNYYAKADDGFANEFGGHRPKLVAGDNSSDYIFNNSLIITDNNIIPLKSNRVLGYNAKDNLASFTEIIPLYKRDYLLCDGKKYYITPITNSRNANLNVVFDRLINLFLAIGYHYTDIRKNTFMPAIETKDGYRYIIKDNSGSTSKYVLQDAETIRLITDVTMPGQIYKLPASHLIDNWEAIDDNDLSKTPNVQDLLWSNDLTSLISYRELLKSSLTNVEEMEIPAKYIYYTLSNKAVRYPISERIPLKANDGTKIDGVDIYIGKEINKFKDKIIIPIIEGSINDFDANNPTIKLRECYLYEHPAVKAFIDLIKNNDGRHATERWLGAASTFGFNVPNFNMQYNKEMHGENNSIITTTKYSNTGNNGIGGFIGTCAYTWIASGCNPAEQLDYICTAQEGAVPHRHHVFRGYKYGMNISDKNSITSYRGYQPAAGPTYVADCIADSAPCYYRCVNNTPFGAINSAIALPYNAYSYLINMCNVIPEPSGVNGTKYFTKNLKLSNPLNILTDGSGIIEPNRCPTSGPIWISNSNVFLNKNKEYAEEDGAFIDFFSPECTYMVPLIKL